MCLWGFYIFSFSFTIMFCTKRDTWTRTFANRKGLLSINNLFEIKCQLYWKYSPSYSLSFFSPFFQFFLFSKILRYNIFSTTFHFGKVQHTFSNVCNIQISVRISKYRICEKVFFVFVFFFISGIIKYLKSPTSLFCLTWKLFFVSMRRYFYNLYFCLSQFFR